MFDEAGNYVEAAAGTVSEEAAKIVPAGTAGGVLAWLDQPITVKRGTVVLLGIVSLLLLLRIRG